MKPPRKKSQKKPTNDTPTDVAEPGAVARENIILERMEEQLRVVADGVVSTRDVLRRETGEMKREPSSKIGVLEFVVRKNSTDIQRLGEKLDTRTEALEAAAS